MERTVAPVAAPAPDFGGFYGQAYPDAVRLAVLLVGVADAEDVVQAAFTVVGTAGRWRRRRRS